jgi:hypothetical protein
MDERSRVKRPTAERVQPQRRFSDAIGLGAAPEGNGAAGPDAGDAAARAVELGYRVVDEYIRQGQKAARRFNDRSAAPAAFAGDLQEVVSRMAQFTTEWVGLWVDLAQRLGGSGLPGAMTPDGRGAAAPAAAPMSAAPPVADRVRIDLVAAAPVEVSVDLRPDALRQPLVAHALRAVDPALPRLAAPVFTPAADGQPAALRVEVPAGHPSGVYSGVIVERDGDRPAGMVSVRVP